MEISGVFDLSGCIWERTAGVMKGGNVSTPEWHSAMATSSTTASTKYVTIYENSYDANNKKGDAVKETSTSGNSSTSWNEDYSNFVTTSGPVFIRGGNCIITEAYCGVFAFYPNTATEHNNYGFHIVLVP